MAPAEVPWLAVSLVLAWFASSAACTSSSKELLLRLAPDLCAVTLTALQFAASVLLSGVVVAIRGPAQLSARKAWPWLLGVAASYTFGFLLLNLSLVLLRASFAETASDALTTPTAAPRAHHRRMRWLAGARPRAAVRGGAHVDHGRARRLPQPTGRGGPRGPHDRRCAHVHVAAAAQSAGAAARHVLELHVRHARNFHNNVPGQVSGAPGPRSPSLGAPAPPWCLPRRRRLAKSEGGRLDGATLFFYQHVIGLAIVLPLAIGIDGMRCIHALGRNPDAIWFALLSAACFFAYNRHAGPPVCAEDSLRPCPHA